MELKSCPFCATSKAEVRHTLGLETTSQVVCPNCEMRGPVSDQHDRAVKDRNLLPRERDNETA
jgi:uncharacterized Zn finger protein (UPF0148 family)